MENTRAGSLHRKAGIRNDLTDLRVGFLERLLRRDLAERGIVQLQPEGFLNLRVKGIAWPVIREDLAFSSAASTAQPRGTSSWTFAIA